MQAVIHPFVFSDPFAVELPHRLQIFPGNGDELPVGVRRLKAVAEITLGVQLFTGIGRQFFRFVQILGAIAVRGIGKLPREQRLQLRPLFRQQTEEPQLFAVLMGILPQQSDSPAKVVLPIGEAVALLLCTFDEQPPFGNAEPAVIDMPPQIHGRKALKTGSEIFPVKERLHQRPVLQRNRFKLQHKSPFANLL